MDKENADAATIASFGDEWKRFDQSKVPEAELRGFFDAYFRIFPWDRLPPDAQGFDLGCGSGRWAKYVAPRVGTLHCIEPSAALAIARQNLRDAHNAVFHAASVDSMALAPASQDFGYSLGVLHHIPDTLAALRKCVALLKPGAPFLVYLYYRFDTRPVWFRALWAVTDLARRVISAMPSTPKHATTDIIAATVYWPLARLARLVDQFSPAAKSIPLYSYRKASFYTMRTDSRDRFGTPLEQRFTKTEIDSMMRAAGLRDIVFSDREPFWVAMGYAV